MTPYSELNLKKILTLPFKKMLILQPSFVLQLIIPQYQKKVFILFTTNTKDEQTY